MYRANEPKFLWVLLLILTITYAYAFEDRFLTYGHYELSFLFFAAMTISYQIEIRERELFRTVSVFGFKVRKRTIHVNEIEKMEIVGVGKRKIVLLYLQKRIRIKLHRFSPEGLPEELSIFARDHQISVVEKGSK